MKRIAWLMLLALWSVAGADEMDIRQIIASINTQRDVPVQFTELRMNPLLAEPVAFTGEVEFAVDGTLTKRIAAPVEERVSIGPEAVILERDGRKRSLSMRRDTDLWLFYSSLRAVLAGDPDGVIAAFDSAVIKSADQWEIELRPRSVELAGFIELMLVRGGNGRIDFVRTVQSEGNWQETSFHHDLPAPIAGGVQ
jgi:hypothetical protein